MARDKMIISRAICLTWLLLPACGEVEVLDTAACTEGVEFSDMGLSVKYDRFADSTKVSAGSQARSMVEVIKAINQDPDENPVMGARFSCAGEGVCRPDSLTVSFVRNGQSPAGRSRERSNDRTATR